MQKLRCNPLRRHQRPDVSTNRGEQWSRRDEGAHACSPLFRPVFRPCNPAQTNIQQQTGHWEAAIPYLVSVLVFRVYTCMLCIFLFGVCVRNHMPLIYLVLLFGVCFYPITPTYIFVWNLFDVFLL